MLPSVSILPCSSLERRLAKATELLPVTFDGHAGMLHRPAEPRQARAAVLLCPSLGRDARCAYRPLFLWANTLASLGFHVLRYDHRGEGDSADLDDAADQWSVWRRGAVEAAEFARAHASQRLVIGGLRIGATLAAAAAQEVSADGLMLFAPFASGRAWLRELMLAAAVESETIAARADGALEVEGLRLSAATVSALQHGAPLASGESPAWRAAFLASIASKDAIAQSLGPNLTQVPFRGYAKLLKEAHLNEPPTEVFEQATAWLERLADADDRRTALGARRARSAASPIALPEARLRGADWIEEPVAFGSGLRGIVCLPARPIGRRAVIFGNTAADARAGVGGFAAKACRTLATAGLGALRFDFRGLGESAAANGSSSHVYEVSRIDDFHHAADLLRRYGFDDVTLAGVCTGGYHAVHAVLEDERFTRAIAINSWLVWRPGRSLEVPRPLPTRLSAAFEQSAWSRLLKGEMDIRRIAAGLAFRAAQLWKARRPDAVGQAARRQFAAATKRGARIGLIYGRGDIALQFMEADFGRGATRLRRLRGVRLTELPGVDHPLFSRASQQLVLGELLKFLELPEWRRSDDEKPVHARQGELGRIAEPMET